MTEWLKERRTIHNAATEGEWWRHECKPCADRGSEDLSIWSEDDPVAQWLDSGNPNQRADRDAIVDAHNTLLTLLTAVENVLEVISKIDREHSKAPGENAYADGMCDAAYMFDKALSEAIEGSIK